MCPSYKERGVRRGVLKRSIPAGKLADYVVLADDRHMVEVEKIKDIEIVGMAVGGKLSHEL